MRLLTIIFIIFSNTIYSQVYEYLPVSYSNIETNPSFTVSDRNDFIAKYVHINDFQKEDNFSYNTFRFSNYFKNRFWGIGLIMSNTNYNDTVKYKHAGLSLGYRNILFNKVYAKIGASYKIVDLHSPKGYFTKYNFEYEDNIMRKDILHNMNFSMTFSSKLESLYLNIGTLNYQLDKSDKSNEYFPRYDYIRLGNLIDYFSGRYRTGKDLSFLVIKEYNNKEVTSVGYFVTTKGVWPLTRRITMIYGGDVGYKEYFNLRPSLVFLQTMRSKKKKRVAARAWRQNYLQLHLSSDIAFNNISSEQTYKPAYVFGLLYNF